MAGWLYSVLVWPFSAAVADIIITLAMLDSLRSHKTSSHIKTKLT